MKNIAGIIHANAASTWKARHGIHWLDLEVEGNEALPGSKFLRPIIISPYPFTLCFFRVQGLGNNP